MTTGSPARTRLPERTTLLAFLLFVVVAGGASVAVRITYAEMAPFWVGASRFALAGIALWAVVLLKRLPLPRGRALLGAVLFGTLTVGLAFLLASWGLVATPASRYQVLMATVPLLTIFLSSVHGVETITGRGVFGSLLAVGGIAFTFGGGAATQLSGPHVAAILLAAVFMAEGGVLIKKFPPNPPIVTNAIGMAVGAVILGIASLAAGEAWIIPSRLSTWLAYLYLLVFVTVLAFLLYMFVLARWSASGTSYGFVLTPMVTIVVASIVVGEQITSNFAIGAGLVLLGVLVGALLPSKTRAAAMDECRDRSGQVLPRCA